MTADVQFRSDFTTEIVQQAGDDDSVLRAMLISTLKDDSVEGMSEEARRGRINAMMKNRHGSVFEHNSMTFRSEAPIFVYREWHRHRIGISINEASGRYTELPPVFYVPPPERPLVQVGKTMAYEFRPGTHDDYIVMQSSLEFVAATAYQHYESMLRIGIAKEVARMVLPVNIYSAMYWTCNARSLMAFLSLRTRRDEFWTEWNAPDEWQSSESQFEKAYTKNEGGAMFPSKPMWEIAACADAMEQVFAEAFPLTHAAFCEFGRVAP